MLLRVKVKPNSRTDEVVREPDGTIRVKIKAPPVDGKANKYLVEFIARYLGLSRTQVRLLKGGTSTYKTLEIDADEEQILALIAASVPGEGA